MATELAKAYVQIIPSAQGITGSISSVLSGESTSAGESAGQNVAGALGKKLKGALVGLGVGKMVMDSIGNASEFESGMAKVNTLFTGSAEQFAGLQNDILNLSSAYGLGANTLAEAAYSAESAGVPMEQLTTMLSSSAKLAIAGFTDIDTALSATAKTMNAYGDAAGSVDDIQRVLMQTQNLGITTVGELGASLANVTPTAAAMGVSFDQVGAALAQMTANGVPTAQATTQLRSAMTELGKAGTKADKSFREAASGTQYAGMSFQEAIASGANLGDVFGMMQKYADASGLSMVDLWGSVEAGNAAMAIAGDVERFNSNLEQMSTTSDVVGAAYEKMSSSFGTSMNRLKESATNFVTTLFSGGDISASFDSMLDSLGDIGEKLIDWLTAGITTLGENLPGLMSSLLDFAGGLLGALGEVDWISLGTTVVEGLIGAMGELGTRLAGLIEDAVSSITGGGVDFSELGTALLGGFGDIVASVTKIAGDVLGAITGALNPEGGSNPIAAIFTAGEQEINTINWAALGENVASAGAGLVNLTGEALAGGFTAAETLISSINWTALGETAGAAANGLVNLTGDALAAGFTAAESLIGAIDWAGLGATVGTVANELTGFTGEALAAPFKAAHGILTAIDWGAVGTAMQSGIGDVWSGLTGFFGGLLSGAGEAVSGVGAGIGAAAAGIGEAIGNLFSGNDAQAAVNELKAMMTDLEGAIASAESTLKETAKETSRSIREGLESELDAGALTAAGNDAGNSIVSGIISGVNGMAGALAAAMRTLAQEALAAMRAELGIASPSSVMRDQVGAWIPAGIAEGIQENGDIVGDAMQGMRDELTMGDIAGFAVNQGRRLGGVGGAQSGYEATSGMIAELQGMRNDMKNMKLVVGKKLLGRAMVDYGGERMNGYIGGSEDRFYKGHGE